MSIEKYTGISPLLEKWYTLNKRDLPWRDTSDPYMIWLSEIILQQTRVSQGYSYFCRFAERYPTVDRLANAPEDEVLKLWQGLGYYSRARNLHAAAKTIARDYGGVFPRQYKDVLALKGVGEYTAAAIVSFAYNEPYAVVDGNVYRVLSRLFAIDEPIDSTQGRRMFAGLAQNLLDKQNPGLHNQAIMEFGALQCVPVSPDCTRCPLADKCMAYVQGNVSRYPVKQGRTKVRNRYFNYFDIRLGDTMYLQKRMAKDIWQNLYELPLIETASEEELSDLQGHESFSLLFPDGSHPYIRYVMQQKHVLSHQVIYARFYLAEVSAKPLQEGLIEVKRGDVDGYPVSRLVHKYLEKTEIE